MMTRFCYSEYLSQLRNSGSKRIDDLSKLPADGRGHVDRQRQGDTTSESEEAVDPVVLAIRRGDITTVNELLLSDPQSLMKESKDGWTPLHEAACCGETEAVKAILKASPASVDKRTLQEQTALLLAVSSEHLSCVRCLLEAGADPDICGKSKDTPLYKACEWENVDMVGLLLSFGATVNQRCALGWTALHQAVARDNPDLCELLLRAGALLNPPNTYSVTPLIVAARQGRLKVLRYLLDKGADVNMQTCDGVTALYEASQNGHREIVALLLTENADANKPSDSGLLPLHVAAQCGHHQIVSLLVPVTSRARLRDSCVSPLHLAAEHDRPAVAAVLLRTGANVNATLSRRRSAQYADRRTSALYFAVANGGAETAELLVNAGASLSLDPVSPLLPAVRRGCVRTVALLLRNGADVNVGIPAYPTTFPGAAALCTNNLPVLRCLLDHGCNALSCFTCTSGHEPHPPSLPSLPSQSRTGDSDGYSALHGNGTPSLSCKEPSAEVTQFCEWLSTSTVCNWAGPIIDLLLGYVGHVQLCGRLTELLESRDEWIPIKQKTLSPRSLLHLCRIRIWEEMGTSRLTSVQSLPLPGRLINYLGSTSTV